jgi:hypothetical protein
MRHGRLIYSPVRRPKIPVSEPPGALLCQCIVGIAHRAAQEHETMRPMPPEEDMNATPDNVEFFEAYRAAINHPELMQPRRTVCKTLSNQLAACGERLWAFGCGGPDFRTALSIAIQFGGSLSTGAVTLAEGQNWYGASTLVRQFIEVEYLVRLFRRHPEQGVAWLRATEPELRDAFNPCVMRKRLGDFRHEEYRAHCQLGGHPNPRAHTFLPGRVRPEHRDPFGNEEFWVDLAQHLRRAWHDIEAIPTEHANERLDVIFQYTGAVSQAIREWEEIDPCSPMIPVPLLADLAAGAQAARDTDPAESARDD